jgi:CheY-like chemotaxis protein
MCLTLATSTAAEPHPLPGSDAAEARVRPGGVLRLPRVVAEGGKAPAVLVAEDHEDSRDALCTLLDALGYRVYVAANGEEAVAEARARRPDLILMDMMMPRMDGFQATRILRADPELQGVPIIAVTAMEGARQAVLAAGCSDLVTKPVDIRAFIDRVRVWLPV